MRGQLWRLNLYPFPITEQGARIVADFSSSKHCTIGKLYLNLKELGPLGVQIIADMLKQSRTVEIFGFFGEPGNIFETIIDILHYNVCIRKVYFQSSDTHISGASQSRIQFLTEKRNAQLIPEIVRSAALLLVATRASSEYEGMGCLALLDKNVIKLIAKEVWATNRDPIWIKALSKAEQTGIS